MRRVPKWLALTPILVASQLACRVPPSAATPYPSATTAPAPTPENPILGASKLPQTVAAPLPSDALKASVHRLSNGMTVYVSADKRQPRVSAWIAVRAGSRNDPAASTGLAHYLEHMLFKGTDELGTLDFVKERVHLDAIAQLYLDLRGAGSEQERSRITKEIDAQTQASAAFAIPNEFDRLYAKLGIEGVNAFTSLDETVYIADLPAPRFEAWATTEAERLAGPSYRLFYPELEAVYEEKNLSIDRPEERMWDAMAEALFPAHPYGTQTTIGTIEHLKTPAFGDMVAFHQRWYVPNNMAIVLAGDIDVAALLPVLERTFGQWKPRALEAQPPGDLSSAPLGRVERLVQAEGPRSVSLSWRAPGQVGEGDAAVLLAAMNMIVSNDRAGIFERKLAINQRVADGSSEAASFKDGGLWSISATALEGQSLAEVEGLLMSVVEELKRGNFNEQDVAAMILETQMGQDRELESRDGRVASMTAAFVAGVEWPEAVRRRARLASVTKDEVVEFARKTLGENYVVVKRENGRTALQKVSKPEITAIPVQTDRESEFFRKVSAMRGGELEPQILRSGTDYEVSTLASGPLISVVNETNQLFSVQFRFDRGTRQEPLLCAATDVLEHAGTTTMTAETIGTKLWYLGGSLSIDCGDKSMDVSVEGTDANMEATLKLVDDWFRNVEIDARLVRETTNRIIGERKDFLDDPQSTQSLLGAYANYGADSPPLHEPSNDLLRQAKPATLKSILASVPDYGHQTLYFGPRSGQDAAKALSWGRNHRALPAPSPLQRRVVAQPTIFFVGRDSAKSSVWINFAMPGLGEIRRGEASLISTYMGGGMSGLIFQEIREARGLAYSAWAGVDSGELPAEPWSLVGVVSTQSDKTVDALGAMLELLRRPLESRRLARSRDEYAESFRATRSDPREVGSLVSQWARLGLKEDPRPARLERAAGGSVEDLQTFFAAFTRQAPIISIVGNPKRVSLDEVKMLPGLENAKVETVPLNRLTSWGR